ncbi:MAG: hypothetical protein JWQ03_1652 [Variovorax sp.]|nr:hypothetical protein [Variovorax sp.]
MRMFGLLGLVLALAIVGLLAKRQLNPAVAPALPDLGAPPASATASPATVQAQGRQLQEQVRQSLDAAMRARPALDEN